METQPSLRALRIANFTLVLAAALTGCAADTVHKAEAAGPDLSEGSLSDTVRADRVSGGTQIISAIKFGATEDGAFATGGTAARPSAVGYTVVGKRGARVKLDLTSTEGDAVLSLYGPLATTWATARRVAYHDDLSSRNTNSRIEIALPSDGTYLIVAQEYYNDAADFTLALACNGPECWLGCGVSCPTGSRCIDHHIVCVRAPCATMTCEPNETPIAVGELGASCGGRGQQQCNAGMYCQYPDAAICGRADGPGTCQVAPTVCTKELFPVCSCSGVT